MKGILPLVAAMAALIVSGCEKQPSYVPSAPQIPDDFFIDPWTAIDASDYYQIGEPGYSTVSASFGSTRSHLENNGDSRVSVLWTAGDSFRMYTRDVPNNTTWYGVFTTSDSGPRAEFSTNNIIWGKGTFYHCIYPKAEDKKSSYKQDRMIFGLNLPVVQKAVPGGVEEGLNLAYAYTEEETANLQFKNILSLLRFRLSGPRVATLDSIVFKSTGAMAGDFVIDPADGVPYISGITFTGDVSSNTVTLSGPFQSGKDYYVAVIPGERALSVTFYDSGGQRRMVSSSNAISCTRGHVADIGDISLGGDFYSAGHPDVPAAELYMEASSGFKPVTIVVVPDGFTRDELVDYSMLAHSAMDFLFDTEPYKTYKRYFNVWILSVASNESGASVTDGNGKVVYGGYHDNYFGSKWGDPDYGDMQLNESTLNSFVESTCPDIINGIHTLAEVPKLVLVNDQRYGGICYTASNSHRFAMVPFVRNGQSVLFSSFEWLPNSQSDPSAGCREATQADYREFGKNTGDWRNLVLHEFGGHCIGRLEDEYWYDESRVKSAVLSIPTHKWSPYPLGLNISATYSDTPWENDLMSRRDQLIAKNPLYARIGSFQGGQVSIYNRWRSEFISCMIDNRQYFSTWQRVLITKHVFSLAGVPFNLEEFLEWDKIYDPVRDGNPRNAPGIYNPYEPLREYPPLPPPKYSEDQ